MNDDRFDGIVVGKAAQLINHFVGIENHAVEVHDADLVAEGMKPGLALARMHSDINQGEDGQHKEEKSASSD